MLISENAAITLLKEGHVVALPTETVYGLAACIFHPQALENIFTTKERPLFDPLIVHVTDLEMGKTTNPRRGTSLEIFLALISFGQVRINSY
jgi:tRNA A37 threonylcarbamoyladenosine synthetase subunit TsaC/SUA5/YrdC